MSNLFRSLSLVFAAGLILSGCANSRGLLDLSDAYSQNIQSTENSKTVVIENYTDNRVFSTNASSPDQPTYDPGKGLDDDTKSRIIARKRNTYGKALGDILLKKGQTSEQLIKNIVAQAFAESGYNVVTEDPGNKAVHADITLDKFWGWFEPGFWSAGLLVNTDLTLNLSYGDKTDTIKTYQIEEIRCQFATSGKWQTVFLRELQKVKEDLKEKISKSEISK
ncbi:MAG: hypothetical protein ACI4M9_02390 [Succinivibrio sp.]